MVDKARTDSEISALLTPDQKEIADLAAKLQRLWGRMHPESPMPMEPMGPMGRMPGSEFWSVFCAFA